MAATAGVRTRALRLLRNFFSIEALLIEGVINAQFRKQCIFMLILWQASQKIFQGDRFPERTSMSIEQTLTPAGTPEVLNRPLRLLIGGEWAEGTEQPLSVINPSTGELLVGSACAGQDDVDRAVA